MFVPLTKRSRVPSVLPLVPTRSPDPPLPPHWPSSTDSKTLENAKPSQYLCWATKKYFI